MVGQLATFLYKHGSDQSRVRALLMHVYHLALHNQYLTARDMLLMSHIPETVQHADIKTQVLFNRVPSRSWACAPSAAVSSAQRWTSLATWCSPTR